MATTKIWAVRGWIGQVVNYVENEEKTSAIIYSKSDIQSLRDVMNYAVQDYKTEKQYYVSGINCLPETARQEMMQTKKQFNKEDGIIAFHAYQSFKPGEVSPDFAHQIGLELANELWRDRFQVLVATHLDKAHIHSHFVINSVSFIDGKKYNDCKKSYALLRETSDRLCREHNLSVIENPKKSKRRSYDAYQAEQNGKQTWWSIVRSDVDKAIKLSISSKGFFQYMERFGYEIKYGKHIAVRPQGKQRFIRLKTLGENYTEDAIKQRILAHTKIEQFKIAEKKPLKRVKIQCSFDDLFLRKISFNGICALYFHFVNLLRKAKKRTDDQILLC